MDVIEASLNSRHGITTSGDACAVVHKFLRRNRHRTDTNNLIEELTRLINAGLSLSTDDVYKNILKDFSWDEQANKFGNSETLNLEKLQHALAHKSRSFIVTAASSLPNITDKSLPKRFEKTRGRTTYSFVPQLLLNHVCRRITKTGSAKLSAYSKQFPGVCLLVDISGFTKLSGHYCARGKDGIDGLQHVTNKFLGQLVEVIYAYGGDIIKFAGDAVICIFSMSKEDRAHWEQGVDQFDVNDLTSDRIFGNDTPAAATHLSIKTANSSIRSAVHPSLVLRAVECAVELREVRMDGLTVHVAISCGEICFGVLGGYNDRWECLVSGACIFELSQCLDDALSQQAVLTSSCVDILRQPLPRLQGQRARSSPNVSRSASLDVSDDDTYLSKVTLESLPSGNYRILQLVGHDKDHAVHVDVIAKRLLDIQQAIIRPQASSVLVNNAAEGKPSDAIKAATVSGGVELQKMMFGNINRNANNEQQGEAFDITVEQFVPSPVLYSLNNKVDLDYLGEIREVTTMFMKWDGYDAVKHSDLLSLQKCFKTTQEILSLSGAFVRQFLVDDKGCVLIACWGVPSHNHLDNAHRALCATVKIRDQLRAQGMPCSFGVTTGNVYCGTVGSTLRREYAVIGSCVNMAARLMSKAKGGIFLDTDTYSHLPANVLYTLESKKPIMLKGRSEPMQYYSYAFEGCVDLTTNVADDYEVRNECKVVFLKLLHDLSSELNGALLEMDDADASPKHESRMTRFMRQIGPRSSSSQQMTPQAARSTTYMRSVLLEGRIGCGKEAVVQWLNSKAEEYGVQVADCRLVPHDGMVSFSMWRKVFQSLMPASFFSCMSSQRQVVQSMLSEMYSNDLETQEQIAFPAMQVALDIRCSYREVVGMHRQASNSSFRSTGSSYFSSIGNKFIPPKVIHDVLMRVFTHLLETHCVLVIVEGVQFADEDSLKLLEVLLVKSGQINSAIVLTAVAKDDVKTMDTAKAIRHSNGSGAAPTATRYKSGNETFPSTWFDSHRDILSKLDCNKSLYLDLFSYKEIEDILHIALNTQDIPGELVEMVLQISGGSLLWVQEAVQFLKEDGAETLLSLLGSNKQGQSPRSSGLSSPVSGGTRSLDSTGRSPSNRSWSRNVHAAPIARDSTSADLNKFSPRAATRNPAEALPTTIASTSYDQQEGQQLQPLTQNDGNVQSNNSSTRDAAKNVKNLAPGLEKLLMCRFDKLSVIDKQLLRTASLIGEEFTQQTLVGILPRNIKPHAFHILKSLVRQRWLFVNAEDPNVYHFCHGYTHQLVYHLTPHGDREALHQSIAAYVERFYRDEPQHYLHIAQHYSHFSTEKTFEYIVKAAHYELVREQPQYESGLSMLNRALSYTSYVVDVDVILALLEQVPQNFAAISDDNLNDTLARKSNEQRLPSAATGSRAGATSGDTMSDATATGSIAHTSQPSVEAEQPPRNHKAVSCGTCFGFLFSFSGAVTPSTAESKIPSPSNVGTTGSFRRAAGAGAGAGAGSFRRGGATAGGGAGPISSVRSVHSAAESVHSYISTHSMADTRNNNANTVRSVMYAEGANDYVHMLINLLETEAEEVRVKLMEENKVQPPSIPSWQRVLLLSGRGSAGGGGGGASMMML